MSFGSIAAYKGSTPTYKALIAAKYGKLDVSLKNIEMHKDNKTPEFLAKFPFGKVPAFTGADGYTIFESSAIAQYVAASGSAKDQLLGSDIKTQAQITQWVDSISNELQHSVVVWVYALLGYYPWNADAVSRAQTDVKRVLSVLDGVFLSRTFLVGDKVTLADISAVCALYHFYTVVLDPEHRAPYPNLNRWFETCINQPEFKAVLGEVKFCEKQPTKPQAKAAPKEASKPAKAAAPAKEAGDESPAAEKPKEKNPLDLLPKSSFVLDEWKRFYSNNDTRPTAINWFWDKFDPEGYSIWRVSYHYN
ncbi:glutathione S-transferase, partial [Caulochytrium protostelioides]